jgi:hypothetical protein
MNTTFENYGKCKLLIGQIKYLTDQRTGSVRKLIDDMALLVGLKRQLTRAIGNFNNLPMYDGYSDLMKREVALMQSFSTDELINIPFSTDKFYMEGVQRGRDILKQVKTLCR